LSTGYSFIRVSFTHSVFPHFSSSFFVPGTMEHKWIHDFDTLIDKWSIPNVIAQGKLFHNAGRWRVHLTQFEELRQVLR
jgi:hypothetical protein